MEPLRISSEDLSIARIRHKRVLARLLLSIAVMFVGMVMFKRMEREFADVI